MSFSFLGNAFYSYKSLGLSWTFKIDQLFNRQSVANKNQRLWFARVEIRRTKTVEFGSRFMGFFLFYFIFILFQFLSQQKFGRRRNCFGTHWLRLREHKRATFIRLESFCMKFLAAKVLLAKSFSMQQVKFLVKFLGLT